LQYRKVDKMSLSKYEIACVTAGVPATGDAELDAIITQGLRYKTAVELMKAAIQKHGITSDYRVWAIQESDKLIEEFRKGKQNV
jgi:hypothetical protein